MNDCAASPRLASSSSPSPPRRADRSVTPPPIAARAYSCSTPRAGRRLAAAAEDDRSRARLAHQDHDRVRGVAAVREGKLE
jgi:hypothetical protein